jgi:hypothetical protein
MFKKYLSLALVILVINLAFGATAFAGAKADKEAKFAAKVKNELVKLGTGTDARVEVKLRDKTKLKGEGYISQISENGFVIVEDNTNTPVEVSYSQTKQVKGNNLSTGAKIAIGIGIGVALFFVVLYFLVTDNGSLKLD